jgi:hypothetical protein
MVDAMTRENEVTRENEMKRENEMTREAVGEKIGARPVVKKVIE